MLLNLKPIKYIFLLILLNLLNAQAKAQEKILLLQEINGNKITGIKENSAVKVCFKNKDRADAKGNLHIVDKNHIVIKTDTILLSDIQQIHVPNVKLNNAGKNGLKATAVLAGMAIFGVVLTLTLDDLGSAILTAVTTFLIIPTVLVAVPLRLARKKYKTQRFKISIVQT